MLSHTWHETLTCSLFALNAPGLEEKEKYVINSTNQETLQ